MATIPEEEEEVDPAEQDTLVFDSEESDERNHSTPPLTPPPMTQPSPWINQLQQPSQVTNQLQEFLDQYPPKLTKKGL